MNWILLRGLGREAGHWGAFPDLLAKTLPGDRIHTINLPGTGHLHATKSPGNIADIRKSVQSRCHHIDQPVMLVGLSLGGMVALDWACTEPQAIAGVVAINTSSAWNSPRQRLQSRHWATVLKLLLGNNAAHREATILSLTSNRTQPDSLLDDWMQLQQARPVARRNIVRQILAASRYRPQSRAPSVPVLILSSKADRLVSHQCSTTLSERWQCRKAEHPWAGHDLPLDDPGWVIKHLQAFARSGQRKCEFNNLAT